MKRVWFWEKYSNLSVIGRWSLEASERRIHRGRRYFKGNVKQGVSDLWNLGFPRAEDHKGSSILIILSAISNPDDNKYNSRKKGPEEEKGFSLLSHTGEDRKVTRTERVFESSSDTVASEVVFRSEEKEYGGALRLAVLNKGKYKRVVGYDSST